ncbi:hypothetical protein J5N97_002438 [Dioscorea zingiberensis]|uniref:7,8-dihydroneopterin aldolase n=1 Tax=Dioscorea zingiberensis TaxID=325984 RepID=A0A9D5D434_9LILI|nr:hypothetical protein J5N97_002438 [Dioscorea zingiberensis]
MINTRIPRRRNCCPKDTTVEPIKLRASVDLKRYSSFHLAKRQSLVMGERNLVDVDKLVLKGLQFHGFHGVKQEEKKLGQKFLVDVDAWLDLSTAGLTDSLTDTISYTDIYRIAKEIVEGPSQNLLESVAHLIANTTLLKFPQISAIRVQVGKPHVAVHGPVDYLGVEILSYVSGYKNRFQNFIKNLREMGDEVIVVTTHEGVPQEFYGAKLIGSWSAGETEKPLLIHVGRLGVEKSLDFLKRVVDRLPGVRIAFVGDGPYRNELETMFSGMPAVFTGMLLGEELSQAYASGDIFVMPSESETLGLVVLEAMASGVPVVAARAGGIPDIIPEDQEGKTSLLYTPGDLDDCVHKLEHLLSSKEFRESMGKAAREEMEKYDWRAATQKIRNEQYNAAIWFWRNKRAQLLRPIQWFVRRLFRWSPGITYS